MRGSFFHCTSQRQAALILQMTESVSRTLLSLNLPGKTVGQAASVSVTAFSWE